MKKIATTFALLALAVTFAATPSMAASLVFDTFTYANGDLVPNGGWANYSGATADVQVNTGHALIVPANANDDHILFAAQAVTAKTYACFDVTVAAFAGQPKPVYFAELKDGGAANLVSRTYVLPLAAGGWTFGISHSTTSATAGVTPWTAALSTGVTYHVVINYDPGTKTSTLWVNPANELSPSVSNTNAAIAALAVSGFGLRQSTTASTLPASPPFTGTADVNVSVDNLGVGSSFADACDIPTPAQPATWGGIKGMYR
jgi:disulfide bond formation protein DsbB